MSNNYLYTYNKDYGGMVKTSTYKNWINNFPVDEVPSKEDYEIWYDVDFTKPVRMYIKYICKADIDVRNLDKATIDMIFNRILGIDDNIVEYVQSEKIATCDSYSEGKIIFYIDNI